METPNRVGIVTINDDANFGNRLQNYALQRAIASLGWQPETIRNAPPPMSRRLVASRAWHALKDDPLAFGRRNIRLFTHRLHASATSPPPRYAARREAAIGRFAAAQIVSSKQEFWSHGPENWKDRYAKVVVGSDQVWNHGFRNAQSIDFLTFAPPEQRIAYAASFGVPDVPTFLRPRYRSWLNGIPHISVRERRGAEIVESLTGRSVPVVVDPTLLLDREHWETLCRLPDQFQGPPYAIRFFLGEERPEQVALVRQIAEERGARLLDLNDLEREDFADLGPTEFVAAIAQADFVATDSFHAGVFSLIHHTPVVVRARHREDTRLRTLFDLHGIVSRTTSVPGVTTAFDPDWGQVDRQLSRERQAGWTFLSGALGPQGSAKGE